MPTAHPVIITRDFIFPLRDQCEFARLSGDWNPIHLSEDVARRSFLGTPIVYGVQQVFQALNAWAETLPQLSALKHLKVSFPTPLYTGETGRFEAVCAQDRLDASISAGSAKTMKLTAIRCPCSESGAGAWNTPAMEEPITVGIEDVQDRAGTLNICGDMATMDSAFPALFKTVPPGQAAVIATISRLVGMVLPGMYSLLESIDVLFNEFSSSNIMYYKVIKAYPRLSRVTMQCQGSGSIGTVNAFFRPPPVKQPSARTLARIVHPAEFAGFDAYIFGGSRGLGEVAAKLLTLGGAEVHLSYRHGKEQALDIVRELGDMGFFVNTFLFRAEDPSLDFSVLQNLSLRPKIVGYFCSPPWLLRCPGRENQECLGYLKQVLVNGFRNIMEHFARRTGALSFVFQPSCAAYESNTKLICEYLNAKELAAGECEIVSALYPHMLCAAPLLPRLRTDQTSRIISGTFPDSGETVLAALRTILNHNKG